MQTVINSGIPVAYIIILIVLLAIVLWISLESNMLRNSVFNQAAFNGLAAQKGIANPKPGFSLSKVQLAFWTIIVVGSFIYVVFFSTGSGMGTPITIDMVNLTLLGIAAGTTVVGKAIDGSQQNNQPTDPTCVQQNQPAKGFFFFDIISDETGVSIHRLQNVLWTLVVGTIYITYVSTSKGKLPDGTIITPVLLGLMGVSSAAYLGVKTTENTAPLPLPVISYTPSTVTYAPGAAVTVTPNNSGGLATGFAITPAMPAVWTFDTSSGTISGTPSAVLPAITYTVTAKNASGTVTTTVTI